MISTKKNPGIQLAFKTVGIFILLALCAFSTTLSVKTASQNSPSACDTLPSEQVDKLKKGDIHRITMLKDSVKISFKNGEDIAMTKADFDALPSDISPKLLQLDEIVYTKVEIESSYPGGRDAWMQYLVRTFRYPEEAQRRKVQGTVVVQFIVDKEGRVSDVTAVSGPLDGGLREEATRVIRGSGRWVAAVANGRPVKSYKKQPITFRLEG